VESTGAYSEGKHPKHTRYLWITHRLAVWRRGESEHAGVLKGCKLLILQSATYAKNAPYAELWHTVGTQLSMTEGTQIET